MIPITVYGCGQDEAALFRELAPRAGVVPTITEAALSEGNVGLAAGNRCISIGHKTQITNAMLLALSGFFAARRRRTIAEFHAASNAAPAALLSV